MSILSYNMNFQDRPKRIMALQQFIRDLGSLQNEVGGIKRLWALSFKEFMLRRLMLMIINLITGNDWFSDKSTNALFL